MVEQSSDEDVGGLLVFQRLNGALMQRLGTIRAHIKDCSRVLSSQYIGKIKGERSWATRVVNGVYLKPLGYAIEGTQFLPIQNQDGMTMTTPQGVFDKAVHVQTMQGARSAVKTIEFVVGARLEFVLRILQAKGSKPSVSEEDLHILFQYGGVHGYGGERGDGEGQYVYTIQQLTEGSCKS